MYPSSNINFNQNPLFFGGQINHHNTPQNNPLNIPNLDFHPSTSLLHLPSPYEDAVYELTWQQLHDLLFQQPQQQQPPPTTIMNSEDEDEDQSMGEVVVKLLENEVKPCKLGGGGSRKRTSEKDRHSKILTANGLRDRRMRLSIPVARKFFALQDLLGFDKASKTVEWLITQSSSEIEQIMMMKGQQEQVNSFNSSSELEAVSGIEESVNNEIPQEHYMSNKASSSFKNQRRSRSSCDPLIAKESRKNAREKARKRTMEKRQLGDERFT